jgi:AraC-like DNA-binding protein
MGEITSIFARKVIKQVDKTLDQRALLESVGIDPDSTPDPSLMIKSPDYYDLLERIVCAESKGHTLPVRVGSSMQCNDYGAFGLAWKSAVSLRGSFDRAVRFGRVLTNVTRYEMEKAEGGTMFRLRRDGDRTLGLRISNEASLSSVVSISRQVCSLHFRPRAVFFMHDGPSDISAHEDFFGCPVIFGADKDALDVDDFVMDAPNRLGDDSISRFFQIHLEEQLQRLADDAGLEHRVRIQISRRLSEGVPTLSEVAKQLGMSARTLQRRLSDRGYSFQERVDAARRGLAEQLLTSTDYSLAEVAFLTGFSEQSGFTRAFKRWAGQTPRSFRLEAG